MDKSPELLEILRLQQQRLSDILARFVRVEDVYCKNDVEFILGLLNRHKYSRYLEEKTGGSIG